MATTSPVHGHALQVLNIPLADAYPHYWSDKEQHQRAARCRKLATRFKSHGDRKPPTVLQIDAAAALLRLPKGVGFAIARGLADGRWECTWSPDTPYPYTAELVFSTDPPQLQVFAFRFSCGR